MNPHTLSVQIHSPLKAKHKQQPKRHRVENRNVAEKPKQIGNGKGHHGRGSHHGLAVAATTGRGGHHGPTVVAAARGGLVLPGTLRFCLFALIRGLLVLGYLLWAFWACLLPL